MQGAQRECRWSRVGPVMVVVQVEVEGRTASYQGAEAEGCWADDVIGLHVDR